MSDQQPAVQITLREIYDKLVAVEAIVAGVPDRLTDVEDEQAVLAEKVADLKARVWLQTGAATVGGGVLGGVAVRLLTGG